MSVPPAPAAPPARRSFNPWPWVTLVAILLTAIPNAVLIVTARRVRPTMVEDHPYLASMHVDADKEAAAAFSDGGWAFATGTAGLQLTCSLTVPAGASRPEGASVALYRPDDPDLDRVVRWLDPGSPLVIDLARPGRWRLLVTLRSGATALARKVVVEAHAPLGKP
jgi:nitrogen fixation protein FixH